MQFRPMNSLLLLMHCLSFVMANSWHYCNMNGTAIMYVHKVYTGHGWLQFHHFFQRQASPLTNDFVLPQTRPTVSFCRPWCSHDCSAKYTNGQGVVVWLTVWRIEARVIVHESVRACLAFFTGTRMWSPWLRSSVVSVRNCDSLRNGFVTDETDVDRLLQWLCKSSSCTSSMPITDYQMTNRLTKFTLF